MDLSTAVFIGLLLGSPLALVAGIYLALALTADVEEYATAKVLGWVTCAPFALVFGAITGPHVFFLIPEHWHPGIAAGLATPYGFVVCWWLICLICSYRRAMAARPNTNNQPTAKNLASKIFFSE